ncbi:hypothetical protein DWQ65_09320 [Treponema phagedenis]|uniref:PSP1 C-terminal domain protein n=1 Tax=Treponema phagedenis TaxID=162 RepID=A0A0B7H230_TREPH|nr:regulatory iron-sulfur-containing complex subunit RicT [Treponema phagedenis]NVP24138.1 hypothetical protein [Treponema phagedenis]QEJ96291.1 hypothetical protein FUT79_14510 [Treponema phagedenis]QEK07526.1 hypothetical protein FUT80_12885 [Treponema phagedenis]QKS93445.1 hypothetical protein HPJ96_13460 [Treponema phagedenis]QLC59656.1 hypothetical protein HW453_13230 [Treponema phagedenis]
MEYIQDNIDDELKNLEDSEDIQEDDSDEPKETYVFSEPLYLLKLDYSQETFYATNPETNIGRSDFVIVPTRYGEDIARVMGSVKSPINCTPRDVVQIIRKATAHDLQRFEENKKKEEEAERVFKEKVELHQFEMKFIGCHYLLEEPKLIFFFSADTRIDFRKLVRDLVSVFRVRIELRQIGVRDESRITGGLGSCGRPFCCHAINDKFKPVSIRMAKEQGLSLNSLKISGQCGRLLCCLAYEHDWYKEAKKNLPEAGVSFYYDNAIFKIIEVNPLTEIIVLAGDDGRVLNIPAKRLEKENDKWRIKN